MLRSGALARCTPTMYFNLFSLPGSEPCANARGIGFALLAALLAAALLQTSMAFAAAAPAADPIVKAREAFGRRDRTTLTALRKSTAAAGHPLAMWVDYWEMKLRLRQRQLKQADLEAFYSRWPGTAVEDRLRKEWIVERGKAGDRETLTLEVPRVREFDDREIECHALRLRHEAGEDVAAAAREAWFAQREADHGCAELAAALFKAGHFNRDDLWARARLAAEQGRRFVAQHAVALLRTVKTDVVYEAFLQPGRFLARPVARLSGDEAELTAIAVARLAARRPHVAAAALTEKRLASLPPHVAAYSWAALAREAAIDTLPQALQWYHRAEAVSADRPVELTADALGWKVRAALRAESDPRRWQAIVDAVDAMRAAQRAEPTWAYWKARALIALAEPGSSGDAQRRAAQSLLESIASSVHFYGRLANEELRLDVRLPNPPPVLGPADRDAAANHPSLTRALALFELRLRDEGRAEWNHGLQGMSDRQLRAAAQRACEANAWSVCMSTSERTRTEVDMAQRFPTPYREVVEAAAQEADLDAAHVYAVMRQESHFSIGARSVAGAAGLMQVMPQTARWIAGRFRIAYRRERLFDPSLNVRLGARYLKLVLKDFGGSHAHAAAAYNAGPSRPRRWRNVSVDDAAAWTELIPIPETRDYVKNVLSNTTFYAALMGGADSLRSRLREGTPVQDAPSEFPPERNIFRTSRPPKRNN